MDFSASRSFAGDAAGVSSADSWMEELTPQWGVDDDTAYKARLCVSELATNLVMHDLQKTPAYSFSITLQRSGVDVRVEYVDDGSAFDPTTLKKDEGSGADSSRVGGLGLRLVHSYVTRISYLRRAEQNQSTLSFVTCGRAPKGLVAGAEAEAG